MKLLEFNDSYEITEHIIKVLFFDRVLDTSNSYISEVKYKNFIFHITLYLKENYSYEFKCTYNFKYDTYYFRIYVDKRLYLNDPERLKRVMRLKFTELFDKTLKSEEYKPATSFTDTNFTFLGKLYSAYEVGVYNNKKKLSKDDKLKLVTRYFENKAMEFIKKRIKEIICEYFPKDKDYLLQIPILFTYGISFFGYCRTIITNGKVSHELRFDPYCCIHETKVVDALLKHELCHVYHRNHGQDFYDLLLSIDPDYYENINILHKGKLKEVEDEDI